VWSVADVVDRFEKHVPPRKFVKYITVVQMNLDEKQRIERARQGRHGGQVAAVAGCGEGGVSGLG